MNIPPTPTSAPRLAVCIPAYDQPEFLAEALTSLCDQGLAREEYVVVVSDDASPTPLAEVVERFADRLQVVYHRRPQNQGHLANWDAAWRLVDAPHVSFLAHDDVVTPGHLGRALDALAADPSAVLVASLVLAQSHPGSINTQSRGHLLRGATASFTRPYQWDQTEWMALTLVSTPLSIVGAVFKTDVFRQCRSWTSYSIWHDRLMLGEMGLHGTVLTLPWIAGHYRITDGQLSVQLWETDLRQFRQVSDLVLEWCQQRKLPVIEFWIDLICATPSPDRVTYLHMLNRALDSRDFSRIKEACETRLQTRLYLSRLDRLRVPPGVAAMIRRVDRLVSGR